MGQQLELPSVLRFEKFLLRPVRASDAELDYEAVMESREFLRVWEQSGWPEDDFTVGANREDLQRLAQRHSDGVCFTFSLLNADETSCLGCVYIFPTDAPLFANRQIKSLDRSDWSSYRFALYFWVRQSRLADELDRKVLNVVRRWLAVEWQAPNHLVVTNSQFEQQVEMLESANLQRRFEIRAPNKAHAEIAYA